MKVRTTRKLWNSMTGREIPAGTVYELGEEHFVTSDDNEPRWMLLGEQVIPHAKREWFEEITQCPSSE